MLVAEVLKVPQGCSRGTTTSVLICHSFRDHHIHTCCRTPLLLHFNTRRSNTHAYLHTQSIIVTLHIITSVPQGTPGLYAVGHAPAPEVPFTRPPAFHQHLHGNQALSHRDNEFHLGPWHLLPPPSSTSNRVAPSALQLFITLFHMLRNGRLCICHPSVTDTLSVTPVSVGSHTFLMYSVARLTHHGGLRGGKKRAGGPC